MSEEELTGPGLGKPVQLRGFAPVLEVRSPRAPGKFYAFGTSAGHTPFIPPRAGFRLPSGVPPPAVVHECLLSLSQTSCLGLVLGLKHCAF